VPALDVKLICRPSGRSATKFYGGGIDNVQIAIVIGAPTHPHAGGERACRLQAVVIADQGKLVLPGCLIVGDLIENVAAAEVYRFAA
jgi:hypothetical protein